MAVVLQQYRNNLWRLHIVGFNAAVCILLFVYFYFGASFTKVWAEHYHVPIPPAANAVKYEWAKVKV